MLDTDSPRRQSSSIAANCGHAVLPVFHLNCCRNSLFAHFAARKKTQRNALSIHEQGPALGWLCSSSSRVCRHLVTLRDFVFSVVLSLATAGIALRLFNIKLPQLHARHIVDKTASRTSSAPAVEQLLSNDLFVGAPCLGCSFFLRLLVWVAQSHWSWPLHWCKPRMMS